MVDGFVARCRAEDMVSDGEAMELLWVLMALIERNPAHERTQSVASHVVGRISTESDVASLSDWWLVAGCGAKSVNQGAYQLPAWLGPLIPTMELIRDMQPEEGTPLGWARDCYLLSQDLACLDQQLDLHHHGPVKLQGEPTMWAAFLDQIEPTVEALRAGTPAPAPEMRRKALQREMASAGVQQNSRRWNEMLNRASTVNEFLVQAVRHQASASPWKYDQPSQHTLPSTVPPDLRRYAEDCLGPVLDVAAEWDTDRLVGALNTAFRESDESGQRWLGTLTDGALGADEAVEPDLLAVISRRRALARRIEVLRRRGIDTDLPELALDEDDIASTERLLAEAEQRSQSNRQVDGLRGSIQQILIDIEGDDELRSDPGLAELASRFGDLADPDELTALRDELRTQRDATRRMRRIDQLEAVSHQLEALGEVALALQLKVKVDSLRIDPALGVTDAEVEAERLRIEELVSSATIDAEDTIREAYLLLTDPSIDLSEGDRRDLLERHGDAERVLHEDDNPTRARDLAARILTELSARRVERWNQGQPERVLTDRIIDYLQADTDFATADILRLHVALKTKPFVILAGLTGSGKSTIARLYAEAVGSSAADGRFHRVAVRPDWVDQSEVLGYLNPMHNRFEPGWLAQVARRCLENPEHLHFVLLDEMNLAPVEQYLSEYLSAMEEHRSGARDVRLPLYSYGSEPTNANEWPPTLPFPQNLVMVGTVNIDETTRPLSDRVLDRANVLQLDVATSRRHHVPRRAVDVHPIHVRMTDWQSLCTTEPADDYHDFLVEIAQLLAAMSIGVGMRSHIELERFLANADRVLDEKDALDLAILQRIIPKIRGFKRSLDRLDDLRDLLASQGCPRCVAVLDHWLDPRLSEDDYIDGTAPDLALLS